MKTLWQTMRGSLIFFVLAPLLMILEVYCDLYQPTLMADIIDIGVRNNDPAYILRVGGQMVFMAILGLIGGFGCLFFSAKSTAAAGGRLRQRLFDHIQTFSFREIDYFQPSTLITRLTNDVSQVQSLLLSSQRILVRAPLLCIGGLFMAYRLSPQLSVVFGITIPLVFVLALVVLTRANGIFKGMQEKLDNLNNVSRETLLGIRMIKAFVTENRQRQKFAQCNDDLRQWSIKAQRIMIILSPLVTLIINLSIIAILWFGGILVQYQLLEVGKIMAFITYILQVMHSLMMSMMIMTSISRAKASLDRINDVLAVKTVLTENVIATQPQGYDLQFEHVYFKYHEHGAWVLEDISFTLKEGLRVGVIGPTGSGKSTLAALCARLYDVDDGKILLGGVDIKQLSQQKLSELVGVVLQENILFSGTVADNLRFGNQEADDELLKKALIASSFAEYATTEGLSHLVEQRGSNFSGGQKQRLTIARTLLKMPKILILDDASSALDFATEAALYKRLKTNQHGTTTIIIAQRINSIKDADLILVLEKGRLVAQGRHEVLLTHCPLYRTICASQLGEEALS